MSNNIGYSSIVFSDEGYSDVDEMWNDISKTLQILFRQGYKCEIYDDDVNIIVINYEYSDDMGGPYVMWLTDEEADLVEQHRNSEEDRSSN